MVPLVRFKMHLGTEWDSAVGGRACRGVSTLRAWVCVEHRLQGQCVHLLPPGGQRFLLHVRGCTGCSLLTKT